MHRFALTLAIVLAACGSNTPSPAADATPAIDASTRPTLSVVAIPTTVTAGETVTIAVTTANFRILDPRTGPPVRDGEGHYHYYLDDESGYTAGWTPSVTVQTAGAMPGVHGVRFVLATSAHEEVMPLVEATTTFTVQ